MKNTLFLSSLTIPPGAVSLAAFRQTAGFAPLLSPLKINHICPFVHAKAARLAHEFQILPQRLRSQLRHLAAPYFMAKAASFFTPTQLNPYKGAYHG